MAGIGERYRDISPQLSCESSDRGAFKPLKASSETPPVEEAHETALAGTAVALFCAAAVYPTFILLNDLLNKFN